MGVVYEAQFLRDCGGLGDRGWEGGEGGQEACLMRE